MSAEVVAVCGEGRMCVPIYRHIMCGRMTRRKLIFGTLSRRDRTVSDSQLKALLEGHGLSIR